MELKFKDLFCYQNLSAKDKASDFYKPENYFDLSLLPNNHLRDEMAPFIIARGQLLTFKSLYVDWRNYLLIADFLSEEYENEDSLLNLDKEFVVPQLQKWLMEQGISPQVKQGESYIIHPSIRYLLKAIEYLTPKNYIYFKDLECYKDVPKDKQNSVRYSPYSYFDLERLSAKLIPQMKDFIYHRGTVLSFSSIEKERMAYGYVADFLSTSYKDAEAFQKIDKDACIRKLKAYLLKNGLPLSYAHKKRDCLEKKLKNHPAIDFLTRVFDYYTIDDGLFHFEDDLWLLERLDFPVRVSKTCAVKSINFSKIVQSEMKNEVKKATLFRLREVSVATVKADLLAITTFCNFLETAYPEILSFTEIDREVLESFLLYLNTEDTRKQNYHSELMHLKSFLYALALTTDELSLMHLFIPEDIPKKNIPVYTFYTDNELRTLNEGFKTLEPQFGRLMILHEILGCRISETLTLKTGCIRQDDNRKYYVHIDQAKVNRSYKKPINDEIKLLIETSIAYTKEHFGDCEYIFVNEKDPTKPISYGAVSYRLRCMILENDLRDDRGELFTIGTHIFRKTYGRRLCDLGLDDSVIAKLLGHSSTSSVKYYRRMTSSVLASGTESLRKEKNEMINKYKGGWE